MMRIRRASAWLAVVLALPLAAWADCPPGSACYELCPRVSQPDAYRTSSQSLSLLFNGQDSWLFATSLDLRSDFRFAPEALQGMARLKQAFDRLGTQVVIAYLPTRGLMHADKFRHPGYDAATARRSYQAAQLQLRGLGYVVPDLGPLTPDRDGNFYQRRDHHWTTNGARKTAAIVAKSIRGLPLYPSLPKQEFVTQRTGATGKYGTLATVGARICDTRFPRQYVETFTTIASASDESALFGDAPAAPSAMLIGTSNSKGKVDYNFNGFLQQQLGIAIDNRAIRGGAYNAALETLAHDGSLRARRPKLLIWELPSQYDLNAPSFFRQVVPELNGGCKSADVLLRGSGAVSFEEETDVLYNGRKGVISPAVAKKSLLRLRFKDPSVYSFFLTTTYLGGAKDKLKVERHPYVKNDGSFLIELPVTGEAADEALFSVGIRLARPTEEKVHVDAEVCESAAA